MKFFIDFEALQFSGRIISIGCVVDDPDNEGFYTLVQPAKKGEKVNDFITQLTGITNEMLETAPTANEAFEMLSTYLRNSCHDELPEMYCYGDSDKDFLHRTTKYLTSFDAYVFCKYLEANLIDYSRNVARAFPGFGHAISLKKVYNLIQEDNEPQKHNALEDAVMLRKVVSDLDEHCSDEDREKLAAMPSTRVTPRGAKSEGKAPIRFQNWPPKRMDADTGADETNWMYKYKGKGGTKYFDSFDTMVMWTIRYVAQGRSIKKQDDIKAVEKRLNRCIENGETFMQCRFFRKEGNN